MGGDTTQRALEEHWSGPQGHPPDSALQVREAHCIRPGTYEFSADGRDFFVDHIPLAHAPGGSGLVAVSNATADLTERVEASNWSDTLNGLVDLVVNVDQGSSSAYSDTAVLDVENAGADRLDTTFSNQANPTGSETDYFRFSAARTKSHAPDAKGRGLARLY
jgi:hypothetical protein